MKKLIITCMIAIIAVTFCATNVEAKKPFRGPEGTVIKAEHMGQGGVLTRLKIHFPIYWPNNKNPGWVGTCRHPRWYCRYIGARFWFEPHIRIKANGKMETAEFDGAEVGDMKWKLGKKIKYKMWDSYRIDDLKNNPIVQGMLGKHSRHYTEQIRLCDYLQMENERAEDNELAQELCGKFLQDPFYRNHKRLAVTSYAIVESSQRLAIRGWLRHIINPRNLTVWIKQDGHDSYQKLNDVYFFIADGESSLHTITNFEVDNDISFINATLDIRATLQDKVYHSYIDLCRDSSEELAQHFCSVTSDPFASGRERRGSFGVYTPEILSFTENDEFYNIHAHVPVNQELFAEDVKAVIHSFGDDEGEFIDHENYGATCDADGCVVRISMNKEEFDQDVAIKIRYKSGPNDFYTDYFNVCDSDKAADSTLCAVTFNDAGRRTDISAYSRRIDTVVDEDQNPDPDPVVVDPDQTPDPDSVVVDPVLDDDTDDIDLPGSSRHQLPDDHNFTARDTETDGGGCTLTPNAVGGNTSALLFILAGLLAPLGIIRRKHG